MLRLLTIVIVAGSAAVASSPAGEGRQPHCSGFSAGVPVAHAHVSWQFRLCADGPEREVQLRFVNHRSAKVAFAYVALTHEVRECQGVTDNLFQGRSELGPGERTHWPYVRHRLDPARSFDGRVWLCLELVPAEAGGGSSQGRSGRAARTPGLAMLNLLPGLVIPGPLFAAVLLDLVAPSSTGLRAGSKHRLAVEASPEPIRTPPLHFLCRGGGEIEQAEAGLSSAACGV